MSIQKLPKRTPKRRFTCWQVVVIAILLMVTAGILTTVLVLLTMDSPELRALQRQRIEAAGETAVHEFHLTLTP